MSQLDTKIPEALTNVKNTWRRPSMRNDLRQIANAGGSVERMNRLFEAAVSRFHPLAARADFRRGVSTESLNFIDESVTPENSQQLLHEWIDPLLVDTQCSRESEPTCVEYERNGEAVFAIAIPLNLQPIRPIDSSADDGSSTQFVSSPGQSSQSTKETAESTFSNDPEPVDGALAMVVPCSGDDAARILAELETLSLAVSMDSALAGTRSGKADSPAELEVLRKVSGFESVKELAYALVNSIANRFECEQVSLGEVSNGKGFGKGLQVKVIAISGVATFRQNSPGVTFIQQAMEECLDHGEFIVSQERGDPDLDKGHRLHEKWSRESGDSATCSFVLKSGETPAAIVSLRRQRSRPFSRQELDDLRQRTSGFGKAIELVRKASRPARAIVTESFAQNSRELFGRGRWGRKLLAAVFLATLLWFCFGTTVYQPVCVAKLTPSSAVTVSAPFDSRLASVHVQAGDSVRAGQPILTLDQTELQLELSRIESELKVADASLKRALSENQISSAAIQQRQTESLLAQKTALEDKLRRCTVVAPFDCVITESDLERQLGKTFPMGESMLTVARSGDWKVEIEAPESVASYLGRGQLGSFVPSSRPALKFPIEVSQVRCRTEVLDGRNVVRISAAVDGDAEWMKSGMKGYARVSTVRKSVWWVSLHRILDAARFSFWF